jgi:hypothetical protein
VTSAATGQAPVRVSAAVRSLAACVISTVRLLLRRVVHLPRERVGMTIAFSDGTTGRVYRETVVDSVGTLEPCALFVKFRLRFVRGWGHTLFRAESLLNTPLFVGFPGFVSKLWLANDENGTYRGIYEWDNPNRAEHYARSLWWVLALVCDKDSIAHVVVPGVRRDAVLEHPELLDGIAPPNEDAWWRPASAVLTRRE